MRDLSSTLFSFAGPSVVLRDLYFSFLTAVPERCIEATWKYFAMSGAMNFVSASCKKSSNYLSGTYILTLNAGLLHRTK